MSLGAGRPIWLCLPLFVFPTQSDMTGAISTPSHSQGPLSANFPLLMIHSSVKGTMFAYGTASCTWHHQSIFFTTKLHKICWPSPPFTQTLSALKTWLHRCNFLRTMETFHFSFDRCILGSWTCFPYFGPCTFLFKKLHFWLSSICVLCSLWESLLLWKITYVLLPWEQAYLRACSICILYITAPCYIKKRMHYA